ncbi:MAG: Dabb family protein [Bacteroidales bacterium]|nr:Dabb family protein [Bacteroidales bacterium]
MSVVKKLETGVNISNRAIAYDLVLVTDFENTEDLQKYIDHPEHHKIVEYLEQAKMKKASVVDYEVLNKIK